MTCEDRVCEKQLGLNEEKLLIEPAQTGRTG